METKGPTWALALTSVTTNKQNCFNWSHPDVFLLKYSRVRSVKTQLIYCLITSVATCFDSQSHHQANLEPYQFGSAHFWEIGRAHV